MIKPVRLFSFLLAFLTVVPAYAQLPPTNTYGLDFFANNQQNVAPTNQLRLRYNSSTGFLEQSVNGGGYTPIISTNGTRVFNVLDYGATGKCATTDDTIAIKAAVAAADVAGGTVFFPTPACYKITSQVVVASLYPVNLISDMDGYSDNVATGNFIEPGANLGATSIFRYQAPGTAHTAHGAGLIRGLSFYDPSGSSHVGNFTMLAALDLFDFNLGSLQNCMFHVLNGGAIRTVFMVQAAVDNFEIRYSGTVSQPALSIEGASSNVNTQSTSFTNGRLEVNYGTYLSINSFSNEVKFTNLGFESDSAVGSCTSCFTFIDNFGQRIFFDSIHMNRNSATQMIFESSSNFGTVSNIIVADNNAKIGNSNITINGANHLLSNVAVTAAIAQTVPAISIVGAFGVYTNIEVANSGGIALTGNAFNTMTNVLVSGMVSGSGLYAIDISGGEADAQISNAIVRNPAANIGGIRITGAASVSSVVNSIVTGLTGSAIAFRDENSNNASTWIGNRSVSNPTSFSASATAYQARGNSWGGVETEVVQGSFQVNGTVNGFEMTSGQVIDSNNTLNLGVTTSTATSIGHTGTLTTVNNSLQLNQSFTPGYRAATTPVTLAVATDYRIGVGGSGARSVTLPAASTCRRVGQEFIIEEMAGSAGVITFSRTGTDTINGATTYALPAVAYIEIVLTCDTAGAWNIGTSTGGPGSGAAAGTWAPEEIGTATTGTNFLRPYQTVSNTPKMRELSCSWSVAGSGGTTGVVGQVFDVTSSAELCSCTLGACTTTALSAVSCDCNSGAITAAHSYSFRFKSTSDCVSYPQNVSCSVELTQ